MRTECTSDHALTPAEFGAVLASCWPDFTVGIDEIEQRSDAGTAWRCPAPPAMAGRIRSGEQEAKWQNGATVQVGDERVMVILTFDPGTAQEG